LGMSAPPISLFSNSLDEVYLLQVNKLRNSTAHLAVLFQFWRRLWCCCPKRMQNRSRDPQLTFNGDEAPAMRLDVSFSSNPAPVTSQLIVGPYETFASAKIRKAFENVRSYHQLFFWSGEESLLPDVRPLAVSSLLRHRRGSQPSHVDETIEAMEEMEAMDAAASPNSDSDPDSVNERDAEHQHYALSALAAMEQEVVASAEMDHTVLLDCLSDTESV